MGKKESIVCKLSATSKQTVETNRHILRQIIEVLVTLSKQNIAIIGNTEEKSNFMAILQGYAKNDPILSNHLATAGAHAKYTSPEIQNQIVSICAQQVLDDITLKCKQADFFALMADESSDCSTREQLSICVHYITCSDNNHEVREEFVGFLTYATL